MPRLRILRSQCSLATVREGPDPDVSAERMVCPSPLYKMLPTVPVATALVPNKYSLAVCPIQIILATQQAWIKAS